MYSTFCFSLLFVFPSINKYFSSTFCTMRYCIVHLQQSAATCVFFPAIHCCHLHDRPVAQHLVDVHPVMITQTFPPRMVVETSKGVCIVLNQTDKATSQSVPRAACLADGFFLPFDRGRSQSAIGEAVVEGTTLKKRGDGNRTASMSSFAAGLRWPCVPSISLPVAKECTV